MKKIALALLILALNILPAAPAAHAQETDFPIVKVLSDAGLMHDLNLTQASGDISVTFNWAYADEQLLAVHTTITGLPEPEQNTEAPFPYFALLMLTDTKGNSFSRYANGTAVGYPGDGSIDLSSTYLFDAEVIQPDGETIVSDYFQAEYGDNLPETIDLHLEISLEYMQTAEPTLGPFPFDFSVPLHPALTFEPGLSAEANGVEMALTNVRITPSTISATLCTDQPDMGLEPVLLVGDIPVQPKHLIPAGDGCTAATFDQTNSQEEPTSLTLTVERLRAFEPTDDPAFWASVQAELAKQGIEIEFLAEDDPYQIEVISLPEGLEEQNVWGVIHETSLSLRETIEGPWTFTITVPES